MIIISIWLILKGLILVFETHRNGYAVVFIVYMEEMSRILGESCRKMLAERSPHFLNFVSLLYGGF